MEFKDILRIRRKQLGLTQQDIADLFEIKSVNVSDWERGEGMPEAGKLLRLAKRLGISVSQLLGEHDLEQKTEAKPSNSAEYSLQWIKQDEMEMLTGYRGTDDEGRLSVLGIMRLMPKAAQKPSNTDTPKTPPGTPPIEVW